MIELKGITWNHPRGYEPLISASKEDEKHHPYVTIKREYQRNIEGNLQLWRLNNRHIYKLRN